MSRKTARTQPTSQKRILFLKAVISFVVAYIFASLAIDTGSLWFYLFAILLIIFGIRQIVAIFQKR